ncbi:MAG: DUF2630 family protein [Propionibacteriaceae bacterium]|jgi:hypothetical protein|nr:DUF2630 family protein [Propionibacteriaceae bacterium]
MLTDNDIHTEIDRLIAREDSLRAALTGQPLLAEAEQGELRRLGDSLDQAWDLLRQRQARRDAGMDPDSARVRPVAEVEDYLG